MERTKYLRDGVIIQRFGSARKPRRSAAGFWLMKAVGLLIPVRSTIAQAQL